MKKLSLVLMSVLTILGIFGAGVDVANSATGAALFSSYCSACHPGNAKQGATVTRINTAISGNTGGMGSLSTLTSADIQAISVYLGGAVATTNTTTNTTGTATTTIGSLLGGITTTTGTATGAAATTFGSLLGGATTTTGTTTGVTGSTTTTGAALYTGNCVSCHGAAGNLSGSSASKISNAISRNKGGMGKLASLTASQIQTITDYLSTVSCSTIQANTNSASGGSTANTGSIATYDTNTGSLNILSILAGSNTYTATLAYDGACASSICFKLTSAAKTNNTPTIFMASKKGDHSNSENNGNNNENENNNNNNQGNDNNNNGSNNNNENNNDNNSNHNNNNENENDDIRNSCTESSVLDSNSGVINISSVQVDNSNYHVALEYYGACDSFAAATCFKVTAVRQNQ